MPVMKDENMWYWNCRVNGQKRFGWKKTKEEAQKAEQK